MDTLSKAIQFVMEFYKIDYDTAVKYYMDEIEAYIRILNWEYDERAN